MHVEHTKEELEKQLARHKRRVEGKKKQLRRMEGPYNPDWVKRQEERQAQGLPYESPSNGYNKVYAKILKRQRSLDAWWEHNGHKLDGDRHE
ncbi:hypothetical protein [Nesterenkonia alba]|uniref:hypothetical protein n=1 Tax=Nesterenkonia alba TaxID=515814 RepID=UPI0003B4BC75|nr:hypothetical protein [Nesterenkonia alba]